MKIVQIITVGDELITGFTADTNAAFIARKCSEAGFTVRGITSIGDNKTDIINALHSATETGDIIITTGGLGPTHDDITKNAAAEFFKTDLVFREDIWDGICERFSRRGRIPNDANRCQAEIISGSSVLPNARGTAPGLKMETESGIYFFMPGVPKEMENLIETQVLPSLFPDRNQLAPAIITLKTFGIPESTLFEQIKEFFTLFPEIKIAFLPQYFGVDLRLTHEDGTQTGKSSRLMSAIEFLTEMAGSALYGRDENTLASVLGRLLIERNETIATAESCTGGLVSHELTNIAGSSNWFERGFVVYSNEAKIVQLGVDPQIIAKHGAVSKKTAEALAAGVKKVAGTDIGLSTTGIAGPGGGTAEKPVGLVYIGYSDRQITCSKEYYFFKERISNKIRFAHAALNVARIHLMQQ